MKLNDVSVKEVFNQIEEKTEFVFFYNEGYVDVNRKVSINAKDQNVKNILNEVLKGTNNTFNIYDRQIVILSPEMKEFPPILKSEPKTEQKKDISGTVKDKNGESIPGVSVSVKGTSLGSITDAEGQFVLSVPSDTRTLVFSFVGMKTQEIPISGKVTFAVVLEEETIGIEEVVAVGYGVKKKRDIIGSVSSINANEINTTSGNIVSSIQGLSSGVQISSQGGTPGASVSINIRGIHSINSGGDPLWIIDGMPIYSGGGLDQAQGQGAQAQSPMSMVNPSDIEDIQILKDAAATSIYGSRGSNGVIIITTKSGKGKIGKANVNLDYSEGISDLTKTPEDIGYTNTSNWFALVDKARSNSLLSPFEPILVMNRPNFSAPITRAAALATNTDWFDKMLQTGHYHDVNLSITKAFDKGSIFTSFNYRNDEGVLKNNNLKRLTGRINVNYEAAKDLTTTIRLNFSHTANDRLKNARSGSFGGSATTTGGFPTVSRTALPWFPIYDENNPSGYWNPNAGTNPVATDDPALMTDKVKQYRALGGVSFEYKLPWIKGLSVKAEGAFDVIQNDYGTWADQYLNDVTGPYAGSYAYESSSMYNSYNYNLYATYNNTFGIHTVTVTAGTESTRSQIYANNMQATGLLGSYHQLGLVQSNRVLMQGYLSGEDYLRSYFGRADYKLKDRYLAGISIREDGSSKFDADYRWGTFTAYSLGWIVSEENFLKGISFINQLKLRGSIGQTGNNKVPNSLNVTTYENAFSPYAYGTLTAGTAITNIGTPGITWETTSSYDGGIDFALFNNRLSGSVAYYLQNVTGLILAAQVAPSTGVVSSSGGSVIWDNLGQIENKGYEFSLSSKNVSTSSFTWTTDVNLTLSKDKVVELTAAMDKKGQGILLGDLDYGGAQVIYRKGGECATFYYPEFAGVDPVHGVDMIYEIDYNKYMETGETVHTGKLIPATVANLDKNKMILEGKTSAPKYYGGLNNTFTFKGFDLGISFIFSGGNYIFDKDEWYSTGIGVGNHVIRQDLVNNSWTSSNTNAKYPELRWDGLYDWDMDANGQWVSNPGAVDYSNDQTSSTRYMYKGDYIRLRNLELGYNLSKAVAEKLNIQRLRVYVSGSNLLTWTKYPGYDPEVALNGGGNVDSAYLPSLKTFNFGFQLKF
ncbi:MAG: TonB-dependent receptor [Peptostreptococcaceae bacterium]|nr:TonB-dependent receptor [Peptostreptococcaceae bacterium]